MKNLIQTLLMGSIGALMLASCMDNDFDNFDPNEQFRLDSIAIREYVTANDIPATRDETTGIWYEIMEAGEPESYTYKLKDTLGYKQIWFHTRVKYQGKLLSGTVFDKFEADTGVNMQITSALTNFYPFNSNIIPAWVYTFAPNSIGDYELNGLFAEGLQKGAKIRIITPSYWGYQNTANGPIPANSPLEFIIDVLDIQDNKTVVEEE